MTKIILDIETQNTFDDVGGKNFEALGVSVVGIYRYDEDRYETYLESQLHRLENLLIDCELLVGFNHRRFDMPVLQRYFQLSTERLPMLDIMEQLAEKIGHRVGLDSVAQATLGVGKTGHGLDAIEYYRKGEWEKLKSYCLNDVKVTREIYEYGQKHGHIYYLTRDGCDRRSVQIDWAGVSSPTTAPAFISQYNLSF